MCKGPDEKGGPYRCPGDMAKGVANAQARHIKAAEALESARGKAERAQIQVDSLTEEDTPQSRMAHGRARARAQADLDRATRDVQDKEMKKVAAQHDLASAQADYDATPRGAGQLHRDIDTARREGDEVTAAHLESRLDRAETRINKEERERRANAERRGESRENYVYHSLATGEQQVREGGWEDDESRVTRLVQEDGISGSSRTATDFAQDRQGWDHTRHDVTLTRVDEEGNTREVTLPYLAGTLHEGAPPTVAGVLSMYSGDAAAYDAVDGDYEQWRREYNLPGEYDDPEGYRAGKADFQKMAKVNERLEKFLGSERFAEYRFDPANV